MEHQVIEVAVQSSFVHDFLWPFLASLAAVFVSIWGSYFIYRKGRSYQEKKEHIKRETEAKDAQQRAWSAITFEVAENRCRLKWLVDNALIPILEGLKDGKILVPPLNRYRLRTSAIDIAFNDKTIQQIGDSGFQVHLKNEREECVDLNLSLEHADSFLGSIQSFDNRITVMTDLYNSLLSTAKKGRLSLEKLFEDLMKDDLRPEGQSRLDLDEIERQTIEKAKALEEQANK